MQLVVKRDKENEETNDTRTFLMRSQDNILCLQKKTKVEDNFTSTQLAANIIDDPHQSKPRTIQEYQILLKEISKAELCANKEKKRKPKSLKA